MYSLLFSLLLLTSTSSILETTSFHLTTPIFLVWTQRGQRRFSLYPKRSLLSLPYPTTASPSFFKSPPTSKLPSAKMQIRLQVVLASLLDDTASPSRRIQTFHFQPSPTAMGGLLCDSAPVISCSISSWFVAVPVRRRMQVGVLELLAGVSKTWTNCSVSPVVWG